MTVQPLSRRILSGASLLFQTILLSACISGGSSGTKNITPQSVDSATPDENAPPNITILSPVSSDQLTADNPIYFYADAWDKDGSIKKVELYSGATKIATLFKSPYAFNWENVPAGNYKLTARAYDDQNNMQQSVAIQVSVKPQKALTVSLVSPADNTSYDIESSIELKANTSDNTQVVQVAFYNNGSLLGTDTTPPYKYTLNSASIGTHDITAIVTDKSGSSEASETRRVIVSEESIPGSDGSLKVYPAVAKIQKYKSTHFSVNVTQSGISKNSFVYQSTNNASPGWKGTLNYMQKANHWTTFSFSGAVNIDANRLDGKTIKTCVIRPLSLKIKPTIQGSHCSFTLTKPTKVSVEIDEKYSLSAPLKNSGQITKNIVKHPLLVFADPLETNVPNPSGPNVIYYGPGLHKIGKTKQLNDNTQVYIAGGAYVIGGFKAGKNPKNISIRGRGILSSVGETETANEHRQWGNHSIDFSSGNKGENLLIEGITISEPLRSCIISYNTVTIRNVKLMSWSHRNDGITAGNNSVIEDSFIKVTDDNIKLYYSNQTIRNNTVWQQTAGAVFKFAWQLNGVSQGNQVSNIDIIHSDVFNDFSPAEKDRPEMRSTNAIFSAMGFKKDAAFRNNSFKNIRIEEKNLLRLMSLRLVTSHQAANDPGKIVYWGDPGSNAAKTIEGLIFENITLASVPYKQSTLYGNKGGNIRNLQFKNLKINGTLIDSKNLLSSKNDSTGLLTAGGVSNITFSQ